jgi:membrane-associated protease RseP (regulator of RpoE activity)
VIVAIISGVLFFLFIIVSVALHEIGHMAPAKRFGVRVPRYFVGFGPTIWSKTVGETEYGVKAFPLGGFVQLMGMYPPESKRADKPSRLAEFANLARAEEWEQITPEDVAGNRLLYQKKTWQKVVTMFGGPFMNILIAFVIFSAVYMFYGSYQSSTELAYVAPCVPAQADATTCAATDPLTPAAAAGLKAGDKIVAFNGVEITSYAQLTGLIRANLDHEAAITVERDGRRVELTPVNTRVTQVADQWDPSATVAAGWLGVTPKTELVKGTPLDALSAMGTMTGQSLVALAKFPVSVVSVVADMVQGKERSASSPMSIVGASVVAGEVASADGIDVGAKAAMFAQLLGSINLFLAIFNLVPLPPLDGGHIAGALYEWLRRKGAKLLRRPDPGFFDTAKLLPVAYAVGGFLMLCGVVLILADIVNPLSIM